MIFTVSVSFSIILTSIRLALTSVLLANTGTSQNALALVLWYSGVGVVGEYHGEYHYYYYYYYNYYYYYCYRLRIN